MRVYLGIAGQADMIGVAPCGGLVIIDWKRSKAIREDNWFTSMRSPIDHLPDCNRVHYQLQLNVYQLGVVAMFLCVLHPSQASYRVIEVVAMDEELDALVSHARFSYGCQRGFRMDARLQFPGFGRHLRSTLI